MTLICAFCGEDAETVLFIVYYSEGFNEPEVRQLFVCWEHWRSAGNEHA